MSNVRDELSEALATWVEGGKGWGYWNEAEKAVLVAARKVLAEPSPVYSEEQVLVSREDIGDLSYHLRYAFNCEHDSGLCGSCKENLRRSIDKLHDAQPAPISPSHPDPFPEMCAAGSAGVLNLRRIHDIKDKKPGDYIRFSNTVTHRLVEKAEDPWQHGFEQASLRFGGAALYRLIEPRVWEFEGTTSTTEGFPLAIHGPHGIPQGTKVKAVVTEILETEKS